MAENQATPKDPIQTRSLSLPIFIATALMLGSLFLALFDEFIMRRPYKDYQEAYKNVYANYLQYGLLPKQEVAMQELKAKPEFGQLTAALAAARAVEQSALADIQPQIVRVAANIVNLTAANKEPSSLFRALTYSYDSAHTDADRNKQWEAMNEVKTTRYPVSLTPVDGPAVQAEPNLDELAQLLTDAKTEKGGYEKQKADAGLEPRRIQKALDEFVAKNLTGPRPETVRQIMRLTDDRLIGPAKTTMGMELPMLPNGDIIQINLAEANWVDRCESCHAGIRETLDMSAKDLMATTPDLDMDLAHAFVSHPSKILLEKHDPETFGCSTCHNGNGRALTSVEWAHGKNKHWLYPLFAKENFEAGCVQCHRGDSYLKIAGNPAKPETAASYTAEVFNLGRWLFQWKGCVGCHKYEGYDTEKDRITTLLKETKGLHTRRDQLVLQKSRLEDQSMAGAIDQEVAGIDTTLAVSEHEIKNLQLERQRVGPDLAYTRAKLGDANMAWLPAWIEKTHAFRPTTKMPEFRYEPGDVMAIAAYIWQKSDKGTPAKHPRGDAMRGKTLFDQRGCLGCHSVTRDGVRVGDTFAAELSRMGDKADFDYVVEWVKNPTNGIMPNLRLSDADSSDIAEYLMTLSQSKAFPATDGGVPIAQRLNDPLLAQKGMEGIRHFGCAGCHSIPGFEEEGRIGVELTKEGSVPKERLDFGRKEHGFKMDYRYNHKHFFETKLARPEFFGEDKHFENPREKLKMPSFWTAEYTTADPEHHAVAPNKEINALTTFLLGSVEAFRADSQIPESFRYNPSDRRKSIQEGWWVVRKYNCIGCHQFEGDTRPPLWDLEAFAEKLPNGGDPKPPTLVGQGFRTDPAWLARFLRNPALETANPHKNGLRTYLETRMPTFRMSDGEIATLVRFFDALSSQPEPFQPPEMAPLSSSEALIARDIFKKVQCFNCHARGAADPEYDLKNANAPILTHVGARLKYDWNRRWLEKPNSMMPGTQMPSNFFRESLVTVNGGATHLVVNYVVDEVAGEAKAQDAKTYAAKTFKLADVAKIEPGRMVITGSETDPLPPQIAAFAGDHLDLIARYLALNYTQAEIPLTLPPKK